MVLPQSATQLPHPWLLGSRDENSLQGPAATPVNVNTFTLGYLLDVGAAAVAFPQPGDYFVAVDSGRDPFTGRRLAGRYELRSWLNDVRPPRIRPVTVRVAAGRPTLAVRAVDVGAGSGVDPLSLVVGYTNALVGAAAYDRDTGLVLFPLPNQAPRLAAGRRNAVFSAADYQETKNVSTPGDTVLPNTATRTVRLRVVNGPAVTWLAAGPGDCFRRGRPMLVLASSTARVRSVRFFEGKRLVGTDRAGTADVYDARWRAPGRRKARHVVRAVVTDARGRTAGATLRAPTCR